MFLLDTNVVSEFVRPAPDRNVMLWVGANDEERMFLSVIAIAEVETGIQKLESGRRKSALAAWLEDELVPRFENRILDVSPPIAKTWGGLMANAKRRGIAFEAMDAFIAATAIQHALTLVTRNVRDFQLAGIGLLNPWAEIA